MQAGVPAASQLDEEEAGCLDAHPAHLACTTPEAVLATSSKETWSISLPDPPSLLKELIDMKIH